MHQVLTAVYQWGSVSIDSYLYVGAAMTADPATGDVSAASAEVSGAAGAEAGGAARAEVSGAAGAGASGAAGAQASGAAGAQASTAGSWAPAACTLPTSERPVRAADFDAVFAATVRGLDRIGPTRLRLDLEPSPEAAARTAELAVAETGCCSFFTFALTVTAGALILDVTVPQQYAPVLAALADRAGAAAGLVH
jgi:hypothetical protein